MAIHQLSLGTKTTRWDERSVIFIIPRSAKSDDFAIISPFSEKKLLKSGIPETVEIYGYSPILEAIEPQIKEFLRNRLNERHTRNLSLRRAVRWGSAAGIITCFFFVFSGFFDDILFDPFFATVFGYTVYREYEEKKLLAQWHRRVDTLRFRESAVLNAIYKNFTQLDNEDYQAINWTSVFAAEQSDILISLQLALTDFFGYGRRAHTFSSFSTSAHSEPVSSLQGLLQSFSRKIAFARRLHAKNELRIGPGYFEIYTSFLDSLGHQRLQETEK